MVYSSQQSSLPRLERPSEDVPEDQRSPKSRPQHGRRHPLAFARGTISALLLIILLLPSETAVGFIQPHTRSALRQPTFIHGTFFPKNGPSRNCNSGAASTSDRPDKDNIPFIIEALPKQPNPDVYKEIAAMCISAFFNDGEPGRPTAPWKELQLAYLRTLQSNDLRRRRTLQGDTNFMLVARRVLPVDDRSAEFNTNAVLTTTPLILDFANVYNWNDNKQQQQQQQQGRRHYQQQNDYIRGEILGFVEVTKKPYGLGKYGADSSRNEDGGVEKKLITSRPFLTNLSVSYEARCAGVGSKLAQRCEEDVVRLWNKDEIVLEVEEDNANALRFYQKRGYKVLFENPTSRRYDLSGLWLQQKRCKRFVMRKKLSPRAIPVVNGVEVKSTLDRGVQALRRLRDSVFAV